MSLHLSLELLTAALMVAFYLRECVHLVRREWKKLLRLLKEKLKASARIAQVVLISFTIVVFVDPVIFYGFHLWAVVEHSLLTEVIG